VVRGHGQVDPVVVGDVVRQELTRVPGGMFPLNRAMVELLVGWAMVGLNDRVGTVPMGRPNTQGKIEFSNCSN
jgi:hypothetical protein